MDDEKNEKLNDALSASPDDREDIPSDNMGEVGDGKTVSPAESEMSGEPAETGSPDGTAENFVEGEGENNGETPAAADMSGTGGVMTGTVIFEEPMDLLSAPETALADTDDIVERDAADEYDGETPLDKNVKLMSPGRMVARRFFRSKLSITGLVMLIFLILFSWLGPVFYRNWGETEVDRTGSQDYYVYEVTDDEGNVFTQIIVADNGVNALAKPSLSHPLGTDEQGMDILARLMYGGRLSLTLSFLTVIVIALLGVIFGGIAGYYGGWVDNVIMRICDILMCLPTLPLMLIIGTVLDSNGVPTDYYIYLLMGILSLFSWPGMARLVRGQILSLREQEYMVAAEAMGYSTGRRIFKHLIPNVLPQILVSMTLDLGSMILYESTLSYLNLGVRIPYASWGTMIEVISRRTDILQNNFNVWGPPGICIIIAVLGFNFIGDGLRDALDPKQRR